MDLIESMFRTVATKLNKQILSYKNQTIDFNQKFKRISMSELIKEKTKIDFNEITITADAIALAKKHHIEYKPHQNSVGHIMVLFFEKYCEKEIDRPTFVYYYPIEVSPLAKKNITNPKLTERFELFICGREFANAFSELNDPLDQYERFKSQLAEKVKGNDEANEMDLDYIEALEYGLAPTGGFGIGIDRMVMLFTNQETVRNVLLFPHMRDEKK
jgi:lysyl-tRNA synthetase class 2